MKVLSSLNERAVSPYLLLVLTSLFWSGNFVLARYVSLDVPPIGLAFWRWLVAGLLLLPFVWRQLIETWPQAKRHLGLVVVLALFSVTSFNTLVYWGLQTTTASNGVLMQSIIPVVIIALAYPVLGARVSGLQLAGILLSLAGVLLIITRGKIAILLTLDFNPGDVWILLAVFCWGLYSVLLKKLPEDLKGLPLLGYTIYIGLMGIVPLYVWEISSGRLMDLAVPATGISVAYVAIFPSLLAYLFWNRAVSEVGPARAGQFIHLMPVFGTLLSILFLGERLFPFHLFGIILVFVGIYLATVWAIKSES